MSDIKELFNLDDQLDDAAKLFDSLPLGLNEIYLEWKNKKIANATSETMTDHDAWLFERSLGIGGSDIGALLSLSPYTTRFELWQDKCLGVNDFTGNNFTKWGNILEHVISQNFSDTFGVPIIQSPPSFAGVAIGQAMWLRANIDFDIPNSIMMGEVKTASAESKKNWGEGIEPCDIEMIKSPDGYWILKDTDIVKEIEIDNIQDCEFPLAYFCQMQYYLMLKGKLYCFLTALIGGNDERHYLIKANKQFQDLIYYRATYFMFHHIIGEHQPFKTAFEQLQDFIAYDHSGEVNVMDHDGLRAKLIDLNEVNRTYREFGKVKKSLETEVKMIIGERTSIVDDGETLATWNSQTRIGIDKDALEDLNPELFEEVKTETVTRVLRLNKKNLKEEI